MEWLLVIGWLLWSRLSYLRRGGNLHIGEHSVHELHVGAVVGEEEAAVRVGVCDDGLVRHHCVHRARLTGRHGRPGLGTLVRAGSGEGPVGCASLPCLVQVNA